MRSRSGDPSYWRQKAAEFRRRALATADESRVVLLRRALEFDRIAEELDELIGGDRPLPPAALPRATSTARTRIAFAGLAGAFAVGCAVGAAGPLLWPGEIATPVAAETARVAEAEPLPPTRQDATELVTEASVAVPPSEPPPAETAVSAATVEERSAEPVVSAAPATLPPTDAATQSTAATEPVITTEITEAAAASAPPAPPAEPLAAPPPAPEPSAAAQPAAEPPTTAPPRESASRTAAEPSRAPESSRITATGHEASTPRRSSREAANVRSRSARARSESLELRRELPPSAPSLSAPAAATPVAARSGDLMSGPAPRAAEVEDAPQECRPYTATRTAIGLERPVRGIACRRPDGRWQLVSEMPAN